MIDCYVHGVGAWRPGQPDLAAMRANTHDPGAARPNAGLLQGPLKRRASLLTRMAIEVFEQAAVMSKTDTSRVMTVWAIAHGEIHTAVSLMDMMRTGDGKLSPTKFHNSVYNTASGYASIATHNQAPSTTLSGGAELVGATLLEATGLLASHGGEVIVVWADEPPPVPFELRFEATPLALALHLSTDPAGAMARLHDLRQETAISAEAPPNEIAIANALPLFENIANKKPGRVPLQPPTNESPRIWTIALSFDTNQS